VATDSAAAAQEETKNADEDEDENPSGHYLAFDDIKMTLNEDGSKKLNNFLTLGKKLGAGAFCKVIKAMGYYEDTQETIPYALKVYEKSTLNKPCENAQASNLQD